MKYFELDCLLIFFLNDIWTFGRIFEYEKIMKHMIKLKMRRGEGKKNSNNLN